MMMFGRAFSQNGEIERASRCRGIYMSYGCYRVVHEVRQPHRSRYGVKRHISALDVAAEQVLGYRTRAGGGNRSGTCPEDTQLLRSNDCAL